MDYSHTHVPHPSPFSLPLLQNDDNAAQDNNNNPFQTLSAVATRRRLVELLLFISMACLIVSLSSLGMMEGVVFYPNPTHRPISNDTQLHYTQIPGWIISVAVIQQQSQQEEEWKKNEASFGLWSARFTIQQQQQQSPASSSPNQSRDGKGMRKDRMDLMDI